MALLLVTKIVTFFVFLVYMELFLIRRWDKMKVDDKFLSLIDITSFLTGNDASLHKILGPNRVIKLFYCNCLLSCGVLATGCLEPYLPRDIFFHLLKGSKGASIFK
jgi:hypothetical protein